jgi:outer membrane biosynthesis protein TonB
MAKATRVKAKAQRVKPTKAKPVTPKREKAKAQRGKPTKAQPVTPELEKAKRVNANPEKAKRVKAKREKAKRVNAKPAKAKPANAEPADATGPAALDPRYAALIAAMSHDVELAAVADELAASATRPGRKFGSRALKRDGKIFAMMSHGRFVVKVTPTRADALVAAGRGTYFDPGHGRAMKAWVSISDDGVAWLDLAREAYAAAGG